ncbi:unnamed protein product [Mytilus coruscus]|uniref:4Fe-4S ferredoxin-type domain-containing protein n=1 Tax=Mytilus coruscus TaxID=42192 RepID=A0A6J8CQA7_MYTCO|nr:unnamed protein product [Mytilus coruscus]
MRQYVANVRKMCTHEPYTVTKDNTGCAGCSSCTKPCHISCTSYDGHEYICSSCEIDIDISDETITLKIKVLEKDQSTQIKEPYPCSVNPIETAAKDNSINSSSMKNIVDKSLEISSLSSVVQNVQKERVHVVAEGNNAQPSESEPDIPKKTKEIKMSEIRQREQKLKKREEELKIREQLNEEMQNERVWLQSYVNKLEMRINELEKSNKILQKKCDINAHNDDNCDNLAQQTPNFNSYQQGSTNKHIEQAVTKLHEKVSGFILQQMNTQFDKIISQFTENTSSPPNNIGNNPRVQEPTIYKERAEVGNNTSLRSHMTNNTTTNSTAKPTTLPPLTARQNCDQPQVCQQSKRVETPIHIPATPALGQPIFYKDKVPIATNQSRYNVHMNVAPQISPNINDIHYNSLRHGMQRQGYPAAPKYIQNSSNYPVQQNHFLWARPNQL